MVNIYILPADRWVSAPEGSQLLAVLRGCGLAPDAPCGGEGRCGKCRVTVNGEAVSACRTYVTGDMTVLLPEAAACPVYGPAETAAADVGREAYCLAFDVGTTTLAACLLTADGRELGTLSMRNPQSIFGADVISRIRYGLAGHTEALTACLRQALEQMTRQLCAAAGIPAQAVKQICVVGNPAMQQLFLGMSVENLARPPFAPVLTQAAFSPAGEVLSLWRGAQLLTVPDISGFVGADTLACILSTGLHRREETTLLVDIGTNGEMVLGNRHRLIACSTAAGPALEGAHISCGMRAEAGAIDRVRWEDGRFACHVVGNVPATGICGSGLVNAVAAALEAGLLNSRGKLLETDRLQLTDRIFLTQEDIRQVQTAKGAIAAGIRLMMLSLQVDFPEIARVQLAGAFGSCLDPQSACRIGLLPPQLQDKVEAIGNAALDGAKWLACHPQTARQTDELVRKVQHLDLSAHPQFPRTFANSMRFDV